MKRDGSACVCIIVVSVLIQKSTLQSFFSSDETVAACFDLQGVSYLEANRTHVISVVFCCITIIKKYKHSLNVSHKHVSK